MEKIRKTYEQRINSFDEVETIMINHEKDNEITILETIETKRSLIKKAALITPEDVRNLLLELFP